MSETKQELTVLDKFRVIGQQQNEIVLSVIGEKTLNLFEKAYVMADAIGRLQLLLTDEYMTPIMKLQGTRLGFLTDKDKEKINGSWVAGRGYAVEIVRNCLIEAVFKGLSPTGNHFNIIGGNMYVTKEGFEYLLNTYPGLEYLVLPTIKQITDTSALVEAKITKTINGVTTDYNITIPLKKDAYTSVDAIIGKSKRKAYNFLYATLTGESLPDGEAGIDDVVPTKEVVKSLNESAATETLGFKTPEEKKTEPEAKPIVASEKKPDVKPGISPDPNF